MLERNYPSKILLLGEHTILSGSKALAVPYLKYSGKWSFTDDGSRGRSISRDSLRSFLSHDSDQDIDHAKLKKDIDAGLWFDSTIPHGYGLGSSGSLVAAIFHTYALKPTHSLEAKKSLARLECHFHGSSSGIDPLVSYIQQPLLIHSPEDISILTQQINLEDFFLLDTGKHRQAAPLISIYKEKIKDPQFTRGCSEVLSKEVDLAIEAMLKNEKELLSHHLWHISKFQWEFFPEMIPTAFRGLWAHGLESGDYILKLCGAGGGGFILGYRKNLNLKTLNNLVSGHTVVALH
jgi:mevalonate kinase